MTEQINEIFYYENEDFILLAFGDENILSHQAFGLKSDAESSALHRGFISTYAIKDNKLVVKDLRFYGEVQEALGGILPIYNSAKERTIYKDLNIVLPYTGYVFFGNLAVYIAWHGIPKEETIKAYELVVKQGEIIEVIDFSEQMIAKLEQIPPLPEYNKFTDVKKYVQLIRDRIRQLLPRRYKFNYKTYYMEFEFKL